MLLVRHLLQVELSLR